MKLTNQPESTAWLISELENCPPKKQKLKRGLFWEDPTSVNLREIWCTVTKCPTMPVMCFQSTRPCLTSQSHRAAPVSFTEHIMHIARTKLSLIIRCRHSITYKRCQVPYSVVYYSKNARSDITVTAEEMYVSLGCKDCYMFTGLQYLTLWWHNGYTLSMIQCWIYKMQPKLQIHYFYFSIITKAPKSHFCYMMLYKVVLKT